MIKFSKLNFDTTELNVVKKILKKGWLTHGKYTELFERELKNFTGAKYAALTSSCTSALHLSCLASGFKKGDEVIVPSQTHAATAHAVEYTGAKARLVDIDLYSGNININEIKKALNKNKRNNCCAHGRIFL